MWEFPIWSDRVLCSGYDRMESKASARPFSSGVFEEKSTSILSFVIGRIEFLAVIGQKSNNFQGSRNCSKLPLATTFLSM